MSSSRGRPKFATVVDTNRCQERRSVALVHCTQRALHIWPCTSGPTAVWVPKVLKVSSRGARPDVPTSLFHHLVNEVTLDRQNNKKRGGAK